LLGLPHLELYYGECMHQVDAVRVLAEGLHQRQLGGLWLAFADGLEGLFDQRIVGHASSQE
jgi:hypothetical protein